MCAKKFAIHIHAWRKYIIDIVRFYPILWTIPFFIGYKEEDIITCKVCC